MIRNIIYKKIKKIVITIISVAVISLILPINTVAFATGTDGTGTSTSTSTLTCPEGWTQVNGSTCSIQKVNGGKTHTCSEINGTKDISNNTDKSTLICQSTNIDVSKVADGFIKNMGFLITIQKFLNVLLWPILWLIGQLMDNSLLFGNGMEERLRAIWVVIRNLVNILFVMVLLGVALYNVLGIGDDSGNLSIKSILPKIIIGIVAVNFSFLGMKIFLDFVNVMTVSIFALPSQVNEQSANVFETSPDKQTAYEKGVIRKFCDGLESKNGNGLNIGLLNTSNIVKINTYKEVFIAHGIKFSDLTSLAEFEAKAKTEGLNNEVENKIKQKKDSKMCKSGELTDLGKTFFGQITPQNIALAMALDMTGLVFYDNIDITAKNIEKLSINAIFSLVLYLAFAVSFIALAIVLLARIIILWIAIAVSPVLLLGLAVPTIREKISVIDSAIDKFVKNAIAPIIIALPMSIGWIMLKALKSINDVSNSAINLSSADGRFPVVGINNLQDLVVAFGTIGVVWIGVFAASEDTIAGDIIGTMKTAVESAGKWMVKAPLKRLPVAFMQGDNGKAKAVTGGTLLEARNIMGSSGGGSSEDRKMARNLLHINNGEGSGNIANLKNSTVFDAVQTISNKNVLDKLRSGDKDTVEKLIKLKDNRTVMAQMPQEFRTLIRELEQKKNNDETRKTAGVKLANFTEKFKQTINDQKGRVNGVIRSFKRNDPTGNENELKSKINDAKKKKIPVDIIEEWLKAKQGKIRNLTNNKDISSFLTNS